MLPVFLRLYSFSLPIPTAELRFEQHAAPSLQFINPSNAELTLKLPTTTIVAQQFNVIKWQLKFNPVA